MKLFAIHAPRAVEAFAGPEEARAAKTGFSWAALAFGPLWLIARGLWLALLAYALLAVAAIGLGFYGVLNLGAAAGLVALAHLYLALEGRALAIGARARAGRPLLDLVYAGSRLEAEKIYLERVLRPSPPLSPRRGAPPAQPEVIGLFPEPGR